MSRPLLLRCTRLTCYSAIILGFGVRAMKRREFITLLGGAAAAWPLAARGQQAGKVWRIGILGPSLNAPSTAAQHQAFLAELKVLGFAEGQNFTIKHARVDDPRGAFVAAAELMRSPVDLVWANGPEVALQAVVGASGFIPIVILAVNYDPIERGYVLGLAHPGGNITGVFYRQPELAAKQLELLTQAFPSATRLGVLWDALSADQFAAAEQEAHVRQLALQPLKLEKPPYDFAAAFRTLAHGGAQMVLVLSSPFFTEHRSEVAEAARTNRLPTMFIFASYVKAGGLMSYGVDQVPMYRRIAGYVAKIFNGTKPADLPVEQASNFKLVVNLRTARAIGVELPTAILLRADEVIE
jgi:putative ABC transport system substrate-binding protein